MILTNVKKFRSEYVELRNIPINVITETNARFDGDMVSKILTHDATVLGMNDLLGKMSFYRDENMMRAGTVKTIPRTKQYIIHFQFALQLDKIRVHENLSTASTTLSANVLLQQMKDELSAFRWPDVDCENPRLVSGRVRKATGKIGGKNDDIAIGVLMLVYFSQVSYARIKQAEQIAIDRQGLLHSVRTL